MAALILIFPCLEILLQVVGDLGYCFFLKPVLVCTIPVPMFSSFSMSGCSSDVGEAVPEGSSTEVQEPPRQPPRLLVQLL